MTNYNDVLLDAKFREYDLKEQERLELEAIKNKSSSDAERYLERFKKVNRYNNKNSTKTVFIRCITNYAIDGSYHPNLREIELVVCNKVNGAIVKAEPFSHPFFDEVVLKKWKNTNQYGNMSWYREYREKEVQDE